MRGSDWMSEDRKLFDRLEDLSELEAECFQERKSLAETEQSITLTMTKKGNTWHLRWSNGWLMGCSPGDMISGFIQAMQHLGYAFPEKDAHSTKMSLLASFDGDAWREEMRKQ